MFNFKSIAFKKNGLDPDTLTDDRLFELLLERPRYVRRPLVVIDGRQNAGRKPRKKAEEHGV